MDATDGRAVGKVVATITVSPTAPRTSPTRAADS